jgi:WhiB family transcriptional regulator, redox-sensing transcriptional regulator
MTATIDDALTLEDAGRALFPLLQPGQEWTLLGRCAQVDPELFFPEKGGSGQEAKRICRDCPVRQQCLEDAMDRNEPFGIWGGLSERERRALRRREIEIRADAGHLAQAS